MIELLSHVEEAVAAVRARWDRTPQAGVILGSGLGGLADAISAEASFSYSEIPHFVKTTALGHHGEAVCGTLEGVPVMGFRGRFHLYEGHSAGQAAFSVRLLRGMGAETLIVSNAAGGVNPRFEVGDVMVIEDQINLMFRNPLIGINDDRLGPRFPDMCAPYDPKLIDLAERLARQADFRLHRGVYIAMLGPTYETRAEYRMCRRIGGDAVGMSTVPEVLAAVHGGMRVLGLSTITNVGSPDTPAETSGHDVIAAAESAAGKLETIVRGVVASL